MSESDIEAALARPREACKDTFEIAWLKVEHLIIIERHIEALTAENERLKEDLEYYRGCGCDKCMERFNLGHDDPPECTCYEIIGGHQPGCGYGAHLNALKREALVETEVQP